MYRITLCLLVIFQAHAFQLGVVGPRFSAARLSRAEMPRSGQHRAAKRPSLISVRAAASLDSEEATETADGLLGRERYVVMNRFQSRVGAGPRFEKRWADRKSSLKILEGFRFFTLLRRADDVELNGKKVEYEDDTPDYMSMTVWETKKNFNSWRTGYAFKEAHGGGTQMCKLRGSRWS